MWAQGRRLQSSDFALAPDWLYDLGRLFNLRSLSFLPGTTLSALEDLARIR